MNLLLSEEDSYSSTPTTFLDAKNGTFTAPERKKYHVTLTAKLFRGVQKTGLTSYAQLFILKNGNFVSLNHYLLVKGDEIADLRTSMQMNKGDTLSVWVGYHLDKLITMAASTWRRQPFAYSRKQVELFHTSQTN